VGAPVSLTVTATANSSGASTTLTYQWTQTGGAAVTLSSATAQNPSFTAPNYNGALTFLVSATDSNGYRNTATKTVNVSGGTTPPSITSQPQSVSVTVGQPATFAVGVTGTGPFTYQWRRNGTAIAGATSDTYTIAATTTADNGAQFSVQVTNGLGSVTSNAATLTVAAPIQSSGGGGGGALPVATLLLLPALLLAQRVRRRAAALRS
jgi:hypothetical protein